MNTFLAAATSALLFLAPFTGSAGVRAALLIALAAALAFTWKRHAAPYAARVPRGIAAAFAAWTLLSVASLAWSVDRGHTLAELRAETFYATLAIGVFFLAAQQAARWRPWCLALLAGTAAVFVLHEAQQAFDFAVSRHRVFEQRGPWSTHLVLVAPLVLAVGWPRPWGEGWAPWIAGAALALLLYAAWETENRIVWVAFAAQFLLAATLARRAAAVNGATRSLRRVTLIAAIVATLALSASIADRTALHFAGASADSLERDVRPRIWSVAAGKIGEAPWLGHGFGREILAADFIPHTPRVLNHPQIRHGHNVFVDVALQLGIVGVAVFVALLAVIAREYFGYLARAEVAALGVLGLLVLTGFLAKCMTDDFLHRHNALVFWALNAMLVGCGRATLAARATPPAGAGPP